MDRRIVRMDTLTAVQHYRFDARGDTSLRRLGVYRVSRGDPAYRGAPPTPQRRRRTSRRSVVCASRRSA